MKPAEHRLGVSSIRVYPLQIIWQYAPANTPEHDINSQDDTHLHLDNSLINYETSPWKHFVTLVLEGGSHAAGHLRKLPFCPLETPASVVTAEDEAVREENRDRSHKDTNLPLTWSNIGQERKEFVQSPRRRGQHRPCSETTADQNSWGFLGSPGPAGSRWRPRLCYLMTKDPTFSSGRNTTDSLKRPFTLEEKDVSWLLVFVCSIDVDRSIWKRVCDEPFLRFPALTVQLPEGAEKTQTSGMFCLRLRSVQRWYLFWKSRRPSWKEVPASKTTSESHDSGVLGGWGALSAELWSGFGPERYAMERHGTLYLRKTHRKLHYEI